MTAAKRVVKSLLITFNPISGLNLQSQIKDYMYVLGLDKLAFEDILETAVKAKYMIQVVGIENVVHVL